MRQIVGREVNVSALIKWSIIALIDLIARVFHFIHDFFKIDFLFFCFCSHWNHGSSFFSFAYSHHNQSSEKVLSFLSIGFFFRFLFHSWWIWHGTKLKLNFQFRLFPPSFLFQSTFFPFSFLTAISIILFHENENFLSKCEFVWSEEFWYSKFFGQYLWI